MLIISRKKKIIKIIPTAHTTLKSEGKKGRDKGRTRTSGKEKRQEQEIQSAAAKSIICPLGKSAVRAPSRLVN